MLIGITIVIQLIIVHVNCLQKYQFISLFLMFLNRPRNVLGLLTTCVWQREERGMKKLIMKIEQDKIYIQVGGKQQTTINRRNGRAFKVYEFDNHYFPTPHSPLCLDRKKVKQLKNHLKKFQQPSQLFYPASSGRKREKFENKLIRY